MKRLISYLKEPVVNIGRYTGIDSELPRWLHVLLTTFVFVVLFIGIGEGFHEFLGMPFPINI